MTEETTSSICKDKCLAAVLHCPSLCRSTFLALALFGIFTHANDIDMSLRYKTHFNQMWVEKKSS